MAVLERKCPKCGSKMNRIAHGSQLPKMPIVSIPDWVRKIALYVCEECGFIEMWMEKE